MIDHTDCLLADTISYLISDLWPTGQESDLLSQAFSLDFAMEKLHKALVANTINYVSYEFICLLTARSRKQMLLSID